MQGGGQAPPGSEEFIAAEMVVLASLRASKEYTGLEHALAVVLEFQAYSVVVLDSPAIGPTLVKPVVEALVCDGRVPIAVVVLLGHCSVNSIGGPAVWSDGRRRGRSIVRVTCVGTVVMFNVMTSLPLSLVSEVGSFVEPRVVFANGAVVVIGVQVVEFQVLVLLTGKLVELELELPLFKDGDVVFAGSPDVLVACPASMVDVALSA